MVLLALTCAFLGYSGTFGVDIDDKSQVWRLQAAIWEKIKAKFEHGDKFRSAIRLDMQLFLLKKTDGKWLQGTGVAALTLDRDGNLQDFELMDDTLCINDDKYFGENFGPDGGKVHVLVARTSRKKNVKDKLCNFYGCYRRK